MGLKFTKGFKPIRDHVSTKSRYLRDCNNCVYFYQDEHDDEEVCQNQKVLEFDICNDKDRVYCCYWSLNGEKEKKTKEPEVTKHSWYNKERRK